MKKIGALILTAAMITGMSVTAFAADGITSGGTDSAEVKGTYSSEATVTVYSVDIAWEGLSFTYNGAFEGNWNPETHEYEDAASAGWAAGNGTITVTNHSNTDITATPSYTAEQKRGTHHYKYNPTSDNHKLNHKPKSFHYIKLQNHQ